MDSIIAVWKGGRKEVSCAPRTPVVELLGEEGEGHGATMFEIFCGHAGIAAECKRLVSRVQAVDWHGNVHLPRHTAFRPDWNCGEKQDRSFELLAEDRSSFVWISPSCMTLDLGGFDNKVLRDERSSRGL